MSARTKGYAGTLLNSRVTAGLNDWVIEPRLSVPNRSKMVWLGDNSSTAVTEYNDHFPLIRKMSDMGFLNIIPTINNGLTGPSATTQITNALSVFTNYTFYNATGGGGMTLLGIGQGASLALIYAAAFPTLIDQLVLINPLLDFEWLRTTYPAIWEPTVEAAFSIGPGDSIPANLEPVDTAVIDILRARTYPIMYMYTPGDISVEPGKHEWYSDLIKAEKIVELSPGSHAQGTFDVMFHLEYHEMVMDFLAGPCNGNTMFLFEGQSNSLSPSPLATYADILMNKPALKKHPWWNGAIGGTTYPQRWDTIEQRLLNKVGMVQDEAGVYQQWYPNEPYHTIACLEGAQSDLYLGFTPTQIINQSHGIKDTIDALREKGVERVGYATMPPTYLFYGPSELQRQEFNNLIIDNAEDYGIDWVVDIGGDPYMQDYLDTDKYYDALHYTAATAAHVADMWYTAIPPIIDMGWPPIT